MLVFTGLYALPNNRRHLFQVAQQINGRVLWANLHRLFWLSLAPFATAWVGESHFAAWPAALYGLVLLFAAIAYYILTRTLLRLHLPESALARALGSDFKGRISFVIYVAAILLVMVNSWLAFAVYAGVAIIWVAPDRRIERILSG